MGYYTGNGVVTGGGESTRALKSFVEWGLWAVRQKSVVSTNVKRGVSLATAQAAHASDSLTGVCGGSGSLEWGILDAEGTKTSVSYSQISDSNLYELTTTTETLNAWLASSSVRSLT